MGFWNWTSLHLMHRRISNDYHCIYTIIVMVVHMVTIRIVRRGKGRVS